MSTADSTLSSSTTISLSSSLSDNNNNSVSWLDLPDALWYETFRFATVSDLVTMEQVCWKFKTSNHHPREQQHKEEERPQLSFTNMNDLWKTHCQDRWKDKPRYKLTEEREVWLRNHCHAHHQHDTTTTAVTPQRYDYNSNINNNESSTNTTPSSPQSTIPSLSSSTTEILFSWKKAYVWMDKELTRTILTIEELESLDWYFNFMPSAGGRGRETLLKCMFRHGLLFMTGMGLPPLPYRMLYAPSSTSNDDDNNPDNIFGEDDDVNDDEYGDYHHNEISHNQKQALLVADFPLHFVSRLQDSGEWLMVNPHVTFVSTDDDGTLTYTDRNFQ